MTVQDSIVSRNSTRYFSNKDLEKYGSIGRKYRLAA